MKQVLLLSLSLVIFGIGCSYQLEQVGLFKTPNLPTPDITHLDADNVTITFDVVKERSLKTCADCHKFTDTAEQTLSSQNKILARVNGNDAGAMPPRSKGYKPLTDCQKKILETWFDDQKVGRSSVKIKDLPACSAGQSAEETKPEPTPTPAPTPEPVDFATLEVNFANLKKEILEPKCLRCHAEGRAKETVLDSVTMIQALELVEKTAEASTLYQVVIPGMNTRFMPPARSGIPPLTAPEADYLKRWIESLPPNEFDF